MKNFWSNPNKVTDRSLLLIATQNLSNLETEVLEYWTLMQREYKLRSAIICYSLLDSLNGDTDSQAAMAQSVEHAIAELKALGLSLRHSLLFDQNLGTKASCDGSEEEVHRSL